MVRARQKKRRKRPVSRTVSASVPQKAPAAGWRRPAWRPGVTDRRSERSIEAWSAFSDCPLLGTTSARDLAQRRQELNLHGLNRRFQRYHVARDRYVDPVGKKFLAPNVEPRL